MLGRVNVGAWAAVAAIAGVMAVPFILLGYAAIDSPAGFYKLVLHVDPASELAPRVEDDSTRRAGAMLIVAGGVLAASSLAAVIMLFRWKTPTRLAGPTDQEELRRPREQEQQTNKLKP